MSVHNNEIEKLNESVDSSKHILKKIKIMASFDWSMRPALTSFFHYLNPQIKWKNKSYDLQLGRIIAEPIKCGESLNDVADFVIDRTVHWNTYYKCWAQQAINSQMNIANHSNTFGNHDKHSTYDLLARCMHPTDRLPTTVLLPQFSPYTEDQKNQEKWEYYQNLITKHTKFGFDPERRWTDWDKVNSEYERMLSFEYKGALMRSQFYSSSNYIQEAVEKYFDNKFPIYLKKAFGGGGKDVYKINSLDELYEKYDETKGNTFHIQEGIEDYDLFVRCMSIGPQVLPMRYMPEMPIHQHYSPEKLRVDRDIFSRISSYSLFINAYHRWTYNSFEAIVKDGVVYPIDFANACPDSNFTSLHVHFPWLLCSLVKWLIFCAVTGKDMRIDMEQNKYLSVFNDPKKSAMEKYEHAVKLSQEYFDIELFNEFCNENFPDIEERMIQFYDEHFDEIIRVGIEMSDFPEQEHEAFYYEYKNMMDNTFRANAKEYLTSVIYK